MPKIDYTVDPTDYWLCPKCKEYYLEPVAGEGQEKDEFVCSNCNYREPM